MCILCVDEKQLEGVSSTGKRSEQNEHSLGEYKTTGTCILKVDKK
jgi:hypothetical protein